ncbi:MAG: diaminopimelate decarboxylase [Pseudomonadota bacterium]
MDYFHFQNSSLLCESVPLRELAVQFGTPLYVYSYATLARHYLAFDRALSDLDHLICYAVKASPNLALIRALGNLGGGADVVSGGELFRAFEAGIPPGKIVYSGVGKTIEEIEYALRRGILMLSVESAAEMRRISEIAGRLSVTARVGFRLNPDVDAKTHEHISTGLKANKFGLDRKTVLELAVEASSDPNLEPAGVTFHIGSQIMEVAPFVAAVEIAADVVRDLKRRGVPIRYLDCGGGLGVRYGSETPPEPDEYARAIVLALKDLKVTVILEPGRSIVGNAGVLVTRVIGVKRTDRKTFVIVDAGMNDLIRPVLYDASHEIVPVVKNGRPAEKVDLVGPICESGDFLGKDVLLPGVDEGDLLCVRTAGAYGFSMSSQYNARPRAAEVLVHEEKVDLIRARERFDDLIRGEKIPDWLKGSR